MHRIKSVSATILREKMQDMAVPVSDMNAKRDIMSLLVRARKADLDKDKDVYAMSDRAMMDQVVSPIHVWFIMRGLSTGHLVNIPWCWTRDYCDWSFMGRERQFILWMSLIYPSN